MSVETEISRTLGAVIGADKEQPDRFAEIRANLRHTLIAAHRDLTKNGTWMVADDKMIDMLDMWLGTLSKR